MINLQQSGEDIAKDVQSRLDISSLMSEIRSIAEGESPNKFPLSLHLDPHSDLLNYSDVQIVSYLCHVNNVTLSLSVGGCEANRDLQELASLSVGFIQASCIESTFALNKLVLSYKKIYDILQVQKPGITLLINTPGSFYSMIDILRSEDISYVSSLLIDRNALISHSIDDNLIKSMLSKSKEVNSQSENVKHGICGGITPINVANLANLYKPDYISTKMFAADASLFLDEQERSSNLLGSFLVLESRVLEFILNFRQSTSSLIRHRKNNLINYTQASAVHRLLNSDS